MRAQVIINDKYLQSVHHIYRYSIVEIIYTHARKKDGAVFYYKIQYKGGNIITMRPHELKILED